MLNSHFISDDPPSWTLTTRLGSMLSEAERIYGDRDPSYTILGIEFYGEVPHVWYPGSCKHVAIRLSLSALHDEVRACYQLAHECIHLLAPSGRAGVPVVEEGLATIFAEDYIRREHKVQDYTELDSYRDAASLVRRLLSISTDAIRALRDGEPSFRHMTAETFASAGLSVPTKLIEELLAPFERG